MNQSTPFYRVFSALEEKEPEWRKKISLKPLKNNTNMIRASPPIQVFGGLQEALSGLGLPNTTENRRAILKNRKKWLREAGRKK